MVRVVTTTDDLIKARLQEKQSVGFVPTMGNLHAGHISLLETALKEFTSVYLSIFVNPKQFGPNEDFNRYPRTLKDDINLIEKLMEKYPDSSVTVYAPKDPVEVFPEGKAQAVSIHGLSATLEGAIRPGHFDGVTTVVYRLFELVKPKKAYFGLKDYQQYVVIKQMVKDLVLPVEVAGLPIIREENGLALSSRNQYLTLEQKDASLILSKSLKEISNLVAGNRKNLSKANLKIQEFLKDKNWNYLEIRDAKTLDSDVSKSTEVTLLAVYQLGSTRLLDNMQMELK